ncbi:MAG: HAMP domain-containing sensor histidine kinase [Halieaceae bacterium]|jgi:signal transduction histidine kinase|nr:HAMP domain-containing sensor histidine kinase [Halieaceae bacterium]
MSEPQQSVGFDSRTAIKQLLKAPPLSAASQLPAARFFGLTAAILLSLGVLATFARNLDAYRWASLTHLGSVSVVLLLSSSLITMSGRRRLVGIALVLMFSSYVSHFRNGDVAWGLMIVIAAGSVLHLCLSFLVALGVQAVSVVGHALLSLYLGNESPLNVTVIAVGALAITGVPALLVRFVLFHLERERLAAEKRIEQISQLLVERSRLMSVITQEVRLPLMSMALTLNEDKLDRQGVSRLRASVEQLRLVVDNLFSSDAMDTAPPRRDEVFMLKPLIQQVRTQLAPLVESEGSILYTDVASDADIAVYGDRFRVRAIIHNLLRNASHYGTGNRIWLNIHGPKVALPGVMEVEIDIETNDLSKMSTLREVIEVDPDFQTYELGSVALGLQVARQWLHQLGGDLSWYRSPRGGDGVRATLPLRLASDVDTKTDGTAQSEEDSGGAGSCSPSEGAAT